MALRLTKKSKIAFALSIVVLSGALGFLIWRVNQPDTVAPGEADAGDDQCNCCSTSCDGTLPPCYTTQGCAVDPPTNPIPCECVFQQASCPGTPVCQLGECDDGSDCNLDCIWPSVNFCDITEGGVCECQDTNNGCDDPEPTCTPTCPPGYSQCSGADCGTDKVTEECSARCAGCNNLYYVRITCDADAAANVCDGGNWVTRPTGSIGYTTDILFSATAIDSDGIDSSSITAKLCPSTVTPCLVGQDVVYTITNTTTTTVTFGGVLSSSSNRLTPGPYTLSLAWADSLGATSATCALSTSFTLLEEETNPNWDISKSVVESCIDEGTENPYAQLVYTIVVSNTGDGVGSISRIEDVLDSKVLAGFVQSGITTPGVYTSGKIVWDYSNPNLEIAAGANKTYTYTLHIDKDSFGTYNNTVTLTPVGSASISASATIAADCEIQEPPEEPEETVPETGIFDSTIGRISVGLVLVILGGIVYSMPNGVFRIQVKENSYKYRERFEKKVAKK